MVETATMVTKPLPVYTNPTCLYQMALITKVEAKRVELYSAVPSGHRGCSSMHPPLV